jgi:hypothetical protein
MGQDRLSRFQNRRLLTDQGWVYFCKLCGDYKPESEFYKNKAGHFGLTYKCREHYKKNPNAGDKTTDHLKLNKLTDEDFVETQKVLEKLGYEFGPGSLPVWEQFNKKHNL